MAVYNPDEQIHSATLITHNETGKPTGWWKFYGTTTSPFTFKVEEDTTSWDYGPHWYEYGFDKYLGARDRKFIITGVATVQTNPPPELITDTNAKIVIDTLNNKSENYRRALSSIVNMLGPKKGGCGECCEGCRMEMTEALRIAKEALDER